MLFIRKSGFSRINDQLKAYNIQMKKTKKGYYIVGFNKIINKTIKTKNN